MVQNQPHVPTVQIVNTNTTAMGNRFIHVAFMFALGTLFGTLVLGALFAAIFSGIGAIFGCVVSSQ